jgi:glycosyltransferase involved in cell wall biosynthesis
MILPLVSITICTYNGESFIEETLNSVLGQTYTNFEVVIVDDGSKDGTLDIIKKYAAIDSRIIWFSRQNSGLPASRNFAFSKSNGQWIAIIDQDDICYPDRIKQQIEIAEKNPNAGLIFCDTNYIDEAGRIIGTHFSNFRIPVSFIEKRLASNLLLRQGCYIDSEACFISKKTVLEIGKLDESLRYACDYEYFIRAGFEINFAYTTDILSAWRVHSKQLSYTDLNRFKEVRKVLIRFLFHDEVTIYTRIYIIIKIFRLYGSEVYRRSKLYFNASHLKG